MQMKPRHLKQTRKQKGLVVDNPDTKNAEIKRIHSPRNMLFTRTRICVLTFALVLALGVLGSFAYLTYTANQTPNRANVGDIQLHIVENINGATAEVIDTDASFNAGLKTKQVKLRAGTDPNKEPEYVRVTFLPKAASASNANVNVAFGESWSTTPATDSNGTYISTDILKLYINPSYSDYWTYSDGTFTSKSTLKRGETTELPSLL